MKTRLLGVDNEEELLRFGYERERENMFLIGSILRKRFAENVYLGAYENEELVGLAIFFERFKSLVVHAKSPATLHQLVDDIVPSITELGSVPDWSIYAAPTIERLKHHGIAPKYVSEQTMYLLTKDSFSPPKHSDARMARADDVDDIVRLSNIVNGNANATVTDAERSRISPEMFFVRREGESLVSVAATHGYSEHYAQVGGVGTHPDHRGKGYAKETVGAICRHWLAHDKEVLLFCANDNEPAKKVYASLGFRPIGDFLQATY